MMDGLKKRCATLRNRSRRLAWTTLLPAGVTVVRVGAGDNVNGLDSNTVPVHLTRARGERFRVR